MNLYDIEQKILDCVDMESGEVIDIEALDRLEMERDTKIENIACWVKDLNAESEALKAEKEALAQRQKLAENKAASLKRYLSGYLAGTAFKTSKVAISFRRSEAVEIEDLNSLMTLDDCDTYLKYSEPTPNKTAIKNAIKNGVILPGAKLVQNQNIQIK